jgi:Aerobic-type carbon monoxide dehydrogenase, large subunit CoxL/CutL homologs
VGGAQAAAAVKWTCERSEAVMADEHGRDNIGEIELALDKDNKFVALRLNMLANIGAYVGSDRNLLSPFGMIGTVLGVYLIPKAYINVWACSPTPTRRRPIAAPGGRRRSI